MELKFIKKLLLVFAFMVFITFTIPAAACNSSYASVGDYVKSCGEFTEDGDTPYYYIKYSTTDKNTEYAVMYYYEQNQYLSVMTTSSDDKVTILMIITDAETKSSHVLYTNKGSDAEVTEITGTLNDDGLILDSENSSNAELAETIRATMEQLVQGINENILKDSGYTLSDIGITV